MQLAHAPTGSLSAEVLLDRIVDAVRANLPPGITPAYLDGFLARHRPTLVAVLDRHLARRRGRSAPESAPPPELWSPAERTAANLRAMEIAAAKHPQDMTPDDLDALI